MCTAVRVQVAKILSSVRQLEDPLEKNVFLNDLCDRNETLFYRLLIDNLEEFAPIVYTPTVGLVCQRFGSYFRRARGMYFSAQDRGLMGTMVHNWPRDDVEVVVVVRLRLFAGWPLCRWLLAPSHHCQLRGV